MLKVCETNAKRMDPIKAVPISGSVCCLHALSDARARGKHVGAF